MKNILKPIFEMITGQYILFDNVLWNYIVMGIIGIMAFAFAWNIVGKLYKHGIISGNNSGSIIHWSIRIIVFIFLFYSFNIIIWLTKFIIEYKYFVFIILLFTLVITILIKSIKKYNKPIVLKEETIKKIDNCIDISNIATGILAAVNPQFTLLPIFIYAVSRTIDLASPEYIKERIERISHRLEEKKIHISDFKKELEILSEHDQYIVINHLRNLLLTCVPEMVNIYIDIIIDFVMNKEYTEREEICEIINALNIKDLNLLKMIKDYIEHGDKSIFAKKKLENDKLFNNPIQSKEKGTESRLKKINFQDRNILIDKYTTIFWKEFSNYLELDVKEMGFITLFKTSNEMGEVSSEWSSIGKSFLKLQNLNVLQLDYINTCGNVNIMNIDRFHITLIGKKIMIYI